MATDHIKFLGVLMTHVKYYNTPRKSNIIQRGSLKVRLMAPLDDIRTKLYTNKILMKGKPHPRFV
jgi:hypothetical protein